MGLTGKGTSRIHVDGHNYRWVVSGNDGFLDLIVERFEGQGQRLAVQFDYSIGDVTPRLVRSVILKAVDVGWKPLATGKQLYLRWTDHGLFRVNSLET